MVAARAEDILSGTRCSICAGKLPLHAAECPLATGFGQQVNPNIEDPEPVKTPTRAEDSEMEVTIVDSGRVVVSDGVHNVMLDEGYILLNKEMLKRYCDNARAYGWEAGRLWDGHDVVSLKAVYESHPQNPFVKPDWDKDLKLPQGWQLTYKDNPL